MTVPPSLLPGCTGGDQDADANAPAVSVINLLDLNGVREQISCAPLVHSVAATPFHR